MQRCCSEGDPTFSEVKRALRLPLGLASSSEVAYYSYTYAVVHKKHFKKVTSYIRSATLVGKFFAFSLAQTLVSTGVGSYLLLNEVSFDKRTVEPLEVFR